MDNRCFHNVAGGSDGGCVQCISARDKREDETCSCEESLALRAELDVTRADLLAVTAERDYLLTGCSASEVRVMRSELAKGSDGWLPEAEQVDFDKVIGP